MRMLSTVSLLLLTACGSDAPGKNDDDTDAPSRFEELVFVHEEGVETTGDFSGFTAGADWESTEWLSQTVDPAKQVTVSVSAVVEDFETGSTVYDVIVDLWLDDVVDGSPDLNVVSDQNGEVVVDVPSCTATAYRADTKDIPAEIKTTYKAHHIYSYSETGAVDGGLYLSVSDDTYQVIPSILGVLVDPDKAIIAGTAYDVQRDAGMDSDLDAGKIEGAQVVVYDDSGNIPDSLVVNYFTDGFPNRDQLWTSADGLWVASNVPTGNLRVEMWGNVGGQATLLGATQLLSEADSINIANIFAGYGDGVKYPADCLAD